jgi:polyhydroxybutyrate depolymerase
MTRITQLVALVCISIVTTYAGMPAFAAAATQPALQAGSVAGALQVGALQRTYVLHVPPQVSKDHPVPLVLVFHGGGGEGKGLERLTHFSTIADREGFIAVYPDGTEKHWNDGRERPAAKVISDPADDVAFVTALLDDLARRYPVDPRRIYSTGMSNGGIFSHFLASHLSQRIAAIAPVVGGIADPFEKEFHPEQPVSVLMIQGTKDPVVPYTGGAIPSAWGGKVIATAETARRWVEHDGCAKDPKTGSLPDTDPNDGCTVNWSTWTGGRDGTEVTLYNIEGGGHTWPSSNPGKSEGTAGKICRDIDASEVIWAFFKKHPKP